MKMTGLGSWIVLWAGCALASAVPGGQESFRFDFGSGQPAAGFTRITPETRYTPERGYGFDLGSRVQVIEGETAQKGSVCTSDRPFFLSVAAPEGNYEVAVTLGDAREESDTTLKAESRRLMLESVRTAQGQVTIRTFTVNVRSPRLGSGGTVRLKPRELGPPPVLDWDEKLTLEFNGPRPCVSSVTITKVTNALTVFLAGDSTVTDQPREPWNSWGQMLPRFFRPGVAVANHAESGESLGSFLRAGRLEKVLETMHPGDYLFIQFGHNDQKDKSRNAGPFTSYKTNLLRFVAEARARGGRPVLITPMHRLRFDAQGKVINTLGDYPAAVRQVAEEQQVPLIDLHGMSQRFYEALGPQGCPKAFQDGTHHTITAATSWLDALSKALKRRIWI